MEEHPVGSPPESPGAKGSAATEFPARLFVNPTGLRAGWRLFLYTVIFFALLVSSSRVLVQVLRPVRGSFSASFQFSAELVSLLSALGAAWIMCRIEGRTMGVYGFPARQAFGKLFWQGCLFGLFEILALIGLIAALGGYSFGNLAEHGTRILWWALFWVAFFVLVGFFEEFLFRGYALYTLADGIGFWPAAVFLSLVFGAVHLQNSGENRIGIAGVLLVGLFWSFTLKRTGSLWFALGMHAAFDFGETFLFSVPDSGMVFPGHLSNATLQGPSWLTGGTPGPEGSVIDFAILLLFFVVFDRLHPARNSDDSRVSAG
jgi:membrane protease YdiL (CAAX protease family)